MSKLKLVFWSTIWLAAVGCATTADDTVGDDDDEPPPFTNGVSTLSGASDPGYVDGARGPARFANPVNVAYGPDGLLYVADFDNDKIRVVDPDDGQTSTLIAQEGFRRPFAMAFADANTLYVTTDNDRAGNHSLMTGTVWRVDIADRTATVVANAIGRPRGIAVLADGRLVIADYMHHVIELVNPATGVVSLLAGAWDQKGMVDGAVGSRFSTPYGVALAADGTIVVADFDNHRLRGVGLDGSVRTLAGAGTAGFADGAMAAARFDKPQGVAVDSRGNLYISDLGNYRVRRIAGTAVDTIAGSGQGGYLDSDDRMAAQLYGLEGLTVSPDGSMVFVADGSRGENLPFNRIRSIKMN